MDVRSHIDLLKTIPFCALFAELRELVKLHGENHVESPDSDEEEEPLSYDEVLIIKVWSCDCVHSNSHKVTLPSLKSKGPLM